jgi:hypothetical protein
MAASAAWNKGTLPCLCRCGCKRTVSPPANPDDTWPFFCSRCWFEFEMGLPGGIHGLPAADLNADLDQAEEAEEDTVDDD